MQTSYTITGTLETDQLVRLDNPVSLPAQRVRITLEPIKTASSPNRNTGETLFQWLSQVHEQRTKLGIQSLSQEEIDAWVQEERESWGD